MNVATHVEGAVVCARRHMKAGWAMISVFMTLGLALEGMHGFKVRWYLDFTNETRRLMFRLGHAHGALLGILNIVFALTLAQAAGKDRDPGLVSKMLLAGSLLMPAGFLLGGISVYGGDPSVGVILVPIGALLLVAALAATAWRTFAPGSLATTEPGAPPEPPRPARKGKP